MLQAWGAGSGQDRRCWGSESLVGGGPSQGVPPYPPLGRASRGRKAASRFPSLPRSESVALIRWVNFKRADSRPGALPAASPTSHPAPGRPASKTGSIVLLSGSAVWSARGPALMGERQRLEGKGVTRAAALSPHYGGPGRGCPRRPRGACPGGATNARRWSGGGRCGGAGPGLGS